MTSFHNRNTVHNQAQAQNHHGPAFHGPVYNGPVQYINKVKSEVNAESLLEATSSDDIIKQSFAFPEMFTRRSNVEDAYHNTCHWILENQQYRNWTAQSSGLLWIKGKLGAGKSTLMAFLYRRLEENAADKDIRLDFFFSARGSALQQQPLGMIRALLHQLFSQDLSIRPLVRKAYHEKRDSFGIDYDKGTWQWQRTELEVLFFKLVQKTAQQRQVQILVDALDEAGGQNARELAAFFHRVNDAITTIGGGGLKICISCRHYPVPSIRPGSEISVEDHNGNDILHYIQDRFVFDQSMYNDAHDTRVWSELKENIEKRAAGVFQWVVLVLNLVDRYVAEGHSPEDVRAQIHKVPQALSDLYEYIVRNVVEEESRLSTLLLFQWVCFATRPLTVEEMRYALAAKDISVHPNMVKCHETPKFVRNVRRMSSRLNSLSGGLVEVIRNDDPDGADHASSFGYAYNPRLSNRVQVIHQPARDFLLAYGLRLVADLAAGGTSLKPEHVLSERRSQLAAQCHTVLYQSCWNYLMVEPALIDGIETKVEREKLLKDWQELPLFGYANRSLITHAKDSNILFTPEKTSYVKSLQDILDRWLDFQRLSRSYHYLSLEQGSTPFHVAAAFDWGVLMRDLLDLGADVNSTNDTKETALFVAAYRGCAVAVNLLIVSGADLEKPDDRNMTPFYAAMSERQWKAAELLLDQGVEIECQLIGSVSSLCFAVNCANIRLTKRLIDAGANINATYPHFSTALVLACQTESSEVVRILLQAGADPNLHNRNEESALTAAASHNRTDMIEMLLEAAAIIDDYDGSCTALQNASANLCFEAAAVLISKGANVNAPAGCYGSVLHAACANKPAEDDANNGHKEAVLLVRDLLASGADINARGGEFETALAAASCYGNDELVSIFIGAGADLNAGILRATSPLFLALSSGHSDIVKCLIEAGADFLTRDETGYSVLHACAYVGDIAVLDVLKHRSADLDAQDLLGRTPLHVALIARRYEHACALIRHKARYDITDAFGRTPLDYLYQSQNIPEILRLLLQTHKSNLVSLDVSAVQNYLLTLIKTMRPRSRSPTTFRQLYDLVHGFAQISNPSLAWPWSCALTTAARKNVWNWNVTCVLCSDTVFHGWYICGQCPYFDLCVSCYTSYSPGMRPESCCNHTLFRIDLRAETNVAPGTFDWFGIFGEDNSEKWFYNLQSESDFGRGAGYHLKT